MKYEYYVVYFNKSILGSICIFTDNKINNLEELKKVEKTIKNANKNNSNVILINWKELKKSNTKKLLCKLGFHKWVPSIYEYIVRNCIRCGTEDRPK
jgi:hypothetical protein